MDNQLKELTLAVLHNNEIILDQTEEFNKRSGDSGRSVEHLRKIYNGIYEKLSADGELTQADCKFLVIAINLTQASLHRQLRTVQATIEVYDKLSEIYNQAAESKEFTQDLLKTSVDLGEMELSEESEENAEPNI